VNNETFLTLSKLINQIYCYSLLYAAHSQISFIRTALFREMMSV